MKNIQNNLDSNDNAKTQAIEFLMKENKDIRHEMERQKIFFASDNDKIGNLIRQVRKIFNLIQKAKNQAPTQTNTQEKLTDNDLSYEMQHEKRLEIIPSVKSKEITDDISTSHLLPKAKECIGGRYINNQKLIKGTPNMNFINNKTIISKGEKIKTFNTFYDDIVLPVIEKEKLEKERIKKDEETKLEVERIKKDEEVKSETKNDNPFLNNSGIIKNSEFKFNKHNEKDRKVIARFLSCQNRDIRRREQNEINLVIECDVDRYIIDMFELVQLNVPDNKLTEIIEYADLEIVYQKCLDISRKLSEEEYEELLQLVKKIF